MKNELNFQTKFSRVNVFKRALYGLFFALASYPRLLLEVFIRKEFGERYFTLSSALTIATVLAIWPFLPSIIGFSEADIWPQYFLWYVFIVAFLGMSFRHYQAQKRTPGVFDFKKYSLDSGKILPFFEEMNLPGIKTTMRVIECFFEPVFFFLIGFFLFAIGQKLGGLLMVCSLIYGLSYVADYYFGDQYVMDMIDEIIVNEELEKAFMDDKSGDEIRGCNQRISRKPEDMELRRRVFDRMTGKDEVFQAK